MSGTTVRISLAAHKKLRSLADQTGESMQTVLDRSVATERLFRWLGSISPATLRRVEDRIRILLDL